MTDFWHATENNCVFGQNFRKFDQKSLIGQHWALLGPILCESMDDFDLESSKMAVPNCGQKNLRTFLKPNFGKIFVKFNIFRYTFSL